MTVILGDTSLVLQICLGRNQDDWKLCLKTFPYDFEPLFHPLETLPAVDGVADDDEVGHGGELPHQVVRRVFPRHIKKVNVEHCILLRKWKTESVLLVMQIEAMSPGHVDTSHSLAADETLDQGGLSDRNVADDHDFGPVAALHRDRLVLRWLWLDAGAAPG